MSVVVGELIQDAYLFAGIGDQYNPLDADSTNLALRFLNDLADSYSTDALKIFDEHPFSIQLIAGERNYLFGPGQPVILPQLDPPQSAAITSITIRDAAAIGYPVKIISSQEFQDIVNLQTLGRPVSCFIEQRDEWMLLRFSPIPDSSSDTALMVVLLPLEQFTAVGNVFNAPSGYRLFFKTALAKVLASINKIALSKDQNDVIAAAELTMKARNSRRRILRTDIPQDRMAGNWFNIFTGYPN